MLRFIVALLILRIKPSLGMFDSVDRAFRVKPWDLDLNIHLNNAKYLKYLDKGRIEHIIQCRGIRTLYQYGYKLIVANTEISYVRSLMPLQQFTVSSRVTGWDQKYVYYEQRFLSGNKLYAIAVVRLALLKGNQTTSPIATFRQLVDGLDSPALPQSVSLLNQLIKAQRSESTSEEQAATNHNTAKTNTDFATNDS